MADMRADVIALSGYVYERTRSRLDGLTDTAYFWEPVPSCWTIRRAGSDKYQADHSDSPGIPPFTTIAWRLWHLAECYGGIRNPQWLGVERQPAGFERADPAPATAAEAIAALERAHAFWQGLLQELSADSWCEPLGPVAGIAGHRMAQPSPPAKFGLLEPAAPCRCALPRIANRARWR